MTPFAGDGSRRRSGVRRLARRQIDAGIHFLVPCGTTGESPTLTEDERVRVVELVVEEAAAEVPGARRRRRIRHARSDPRRRTGCVQAGATGLLSVTPYYNKPTPEGLYQHYRAIAEGVRLPIIVYNVPGRTGVNVDPATLARLSDDSGHRRRQGSVRQHGADLRGVPGRAGRVRRAVRRRFADAAGRWRSAGTGIISVASNGVPAEMARMVELAEAGTSPRRGGSIASLMPFMTVNFVEANPIPIKAAMAMMGLLEERYRLPMVPPQPASREKIAAVLDAMGGSRRGARPARRHDDRCRSGSSSCSRSGAAAPRDEARALIARACAPRCRPARSAPPNRMPRRLAAGGSTPG